MYAALNRTPTKAEMKAQAKDSKKEKKEKKPEKEEKKKRKSFKDAGKGE